MNPGMPAMVDPRNIPGAQTGAVQEQPRVSSKQQGKTHGETVSLHIELAAYFRRPNRTPAPAAQ